MTKNTLCFDLSQTNLNNSDICRILESIRARKQSFQFPDNITIRVSWRGRHLLYIDASGNVASVFEEDSSCYLSQETIGRLSEIDIFTVREFSDLPLYMKDNLFISHIIVNGYVSNVRPYQKNVSAKDCGFVLSNFQLEELSHNYNVYLILKNKPLKYQGAL